MSVTIKPISAIFDKDTDKLGKSDPYVICVLGQDKKKSSVCKSGGVKPNWQDALTFNTKQTQLLIQVWDKDKIGSDDLMGSATWDIKKAFISPGQNYTEYVNLTNHGKPAGQIQISAQYDGPALNQGGQQGNQNQGGQQGQQNWQQQPSQPWHKNPQPNKGGQGFTIGGSGGAKDWNQQHKN